MYRQGFEYPVRTATDIFGDRNISLTIRSELEIRSPSVRAIENVERAAISPFWTKNTNVTNATITCATRTER